MSLKNYDFFVAIYTSGDLTLNELRNECQDGEWTPVLILRTSKGIVVPLFRDPVICFEFLKRNITTNQLTGVMGMSEVDLQRFTDRGWEIDWHTYPKRYLTRPGYQLDVEVIETDFDLYLAGKAPTLQPQR